ncbi:hypothetical protein K9202_004597 [Salmonella enterica subsp. enterica serovar Infantis]|nr:hypothetical protein [Salmonella enterica subsp. enterica serovar Infantis]
MKKSIIATVFALTTSSAMAAVNQASQGEVQFVGAVAAKTCDVIITGDGAVNNQVQFGVLTTNADVTKDFTVSLKDPTCVTSSGTAKFEWHSPALTDTGIKNQSGSADNAYVELKAKNGATNAPSRSDAITALNNGVNFTITQPEMGFEYEATLHAGTTPGSFETAASYTVLYE